MALKRPPRGTRPAPAPPLRLGCIFYRTGPGNEPVRDWLKNDIPVEARKVIGTDIKTVQAMWPIDRPLVDNLGPGIWEVRSTHNKIEYRVVFTVDGSTMVLLHGFIKNTTKARKSDIDLAFRRKSLREKLR